MVQAELDRYTVTRQTAHYAFRAQPDSLAARDIERIAVYQEKWFERITQVLGVMPQKPIQYYLTPSALDAGLIYGDGEPCNGFAWGQDRVVATYNEQVCCLGPHEDTHLIALLIARPDSVFLREGLAMYMDGHWWGKDNAWWVKQFMVDGSYVPLEGLLSDGDFFSHSDAVTYPISGAFTRFMMESLGKENFIKRVYSTKKPVQSALEEAFGKALTEIEADFLAWLSALNPPEKHMDDIEF